jgi:hypothetical protein
VIFLMDASTPATVLEMPTQHSLEPAAIQAAILSAGFQMGVKMQLAVSCAFATVKVLEAVRDFLT